MSDFDEVFRVNKEVREDPDRPAFQGEFDVYDEMSCELALFEADRLVDSYFEKFRSRFKNPQMFEDLCMVYRKKFRANIRLFWKEAKALQENYGYSSEDEDGNV